MLSRTIVTVLLASLFVMPSTSYGNTLDKSNQWLLRIITDGGFAGNGMGGVSISSKGLIGTFDPTFEWRGFPCCGRLTTSQSATVRSLIVELGSIELDWDPFSHDSRCDDEFWYWVEVTYLNDEGQMTPFKAKFPASSDCRVHDVPAPLISLVEFAWELREAVRNDCDYYPFE